MAVGLVVAYVGSLALVYALFVRFRSRNSELRQEIWVAPHKTRDDYRALHQSMPDDMGTEDVKQLKTLLMRRAMTNVQRLQVMREDRPALQQLMNRGAVGDSLWNEHLASQRDLDEEFKECMQEADDLQSGWGKTIMKQAVDLCTRERERSYEEHRKRAMAADEEETPVMQRNREQLERELVAQEQRENAEQKSKKAGTSVSKRK